jgi:hypothetical protein
MQPDLHDTVRQFLECLIWDQPMKVETALSDVMTTEVASLPMALRQALGDVAPSAEWHQLEFLLEDVKAMAEQRGILTDLEDADADNFDMDEPEEFLAGLQRRVLDYGYDVWGWENGEEELCVLLARTDDRETLQRLARVLGLTEANDAALRCAAYL